MLKLGSFYPQAHVAEAVEFLEGSNIGLSSEVCRPSSPIVAGTRDGGIHGVSGSLGRSHTRHYHGRVDRACHRRGSKAGVEPVEPGRGEVW